MQRGPAAGLWLEFDPRFEAPFWRGETEPRVQDAFTRLVRSGDVIYDVGAHIGFFTLLAARLAGPGGRVFAFEPDSENAARLAANVHANGFSNVEVQQAAVWSSSGTVAFQERGIGGKDTGYVQVQPGASGNVTTVPAVALDDFARAHPLPNFIKIDVEGAEIEVLKGSQRLLEQAQPILVCEVHSSDDTRGVCQWFRDRQYVVERLSESETTFHLLALPRKP